MLWWGNSGDVSQGQVSLSILGNTIDFVVSDRAGGTGTLSVYAYRVPAASRCDAPGGCDVQVSIGHDFPVTFP
jgi:hypothetical protein